MNKREEEEEIVRLVFGGMNTQGQLMPNLFLYVMRE